MTKNICRICLKAADTSGRYVTVHESHKNLTLAALFHQTTGFWIEVHEPQVFCDGCRLELIQCFQFIQKCKKTQEYLKGFVSVSAPQPRKIKVEPEVEEKLVPENLLKIECDNPDSDFGGDTNVFNDSEPEDSKLLTEDHKPDPSDLPSLNLPCDLCTDSSQLYNSEVTLNCHKIKYHKSNRCKFCKKFFAALKTHAVECSFNPINLSSLNLGAGTYTCSHCKGSKLKVYSRKSFENHLKVVHALEKTVNCQYCLIFCYPELVKSHEMICQKNPNKIARPECERRITKPKPKADCSYCGLTLSKEHLPLHIQSKHKDKLDTDLKDETRVFCDHCPGKSFTKKILIVHMKKVHLKLQAPTQQLCTLCGAAFQSQGFLNIHCRKMHTELFPLLECTYCPHKTAYPEGLRRHIEKHLLGGAAKTFCCDMCGKNFSSKNMLTLHLATHSDKRTFSCDFCDKSFKTHVALKLHKERVHSEKSYECPVCQEAFSTNYLNRKHIRRRHPQYQLPPLGTVMKKNPTNTYKNVIIPYSQFTENPRKSSAAVQSFKWQFQCDLCDNRFKTEKALIIHKDRVHVQGISYDCPVCQKSCTTNHNRKMHIRKVHPEYPLPAPETARKKVRSEKIKNVGVPFSLFQENH